MDDIWVIVGSIVLMVLSSLSSMKKRKGSTSSVDMEEVPEELLADDEEVVKPIDEELPAYNYNNETQEKLEEYYSYENEILERETLETIKDTYVRIEKKESDVEEEPKDENKTSLEREVEFDLRKAVIYSTIITNPYIEQKK